MGRFRSWANKANNVDAADTLAMENSNVGALLYAAGGYNDMVFAWYEADQFRGGVQFGDNEDTNAVTNVSDNDFDMHYRVEFIAMGTWDDTDDFNSVAGTGQVLAFGFGGFEGDFGDNALELEGSHEMTNYDVTYKNDAFGAHLAIGTVEVSDDLGAVQGDVNFMTLQASYFVQDNMQVFATMEQVELEPVGLPAVDIDAVSPMTFGVNYFYGDDVKATIQYTDRQIDFDKENGEGDSVLAAQVQFTF